MILRERVCEGGSPDGVEEAQGRTCLPATLASRPEVSLQRTVVRGT